MERITFWSRGGAAWLSNFAPDRFEFRGRTCPTAEHAYQAAKAAMPAGAGRVLACRSAAEARRTGRQIAMRPDWNRVKVQTMREVIEARFAPGRPAAARLAATGDAELVHHAPWDGYWGTGRDGRGRNELGRMLMAQRSRLQERERGGGPAKQGEADTGRERTTPAEGKPAAARRAEAAADRQPAAAVRTAAELLEEGWKPANVIAMRGGRIGVTMRGPTPEKGDELDLAFGAADGPLPPALGTALRAQARREREAGAPEAASAKEVERVAGGGGEPGRERTSGPEPVVRSPGAEPGAMPGAAARETGRPAGRQEGMGR